VRRVLAAATALLLAAPAAASAAPSASLPRDSTAAESAGELIVPVTLSEPSASTVRVSWRTASAARYVAGAAEATAGKEFTAGSGRLQFAPGVRKAEITVELLDDAVDDVSPFLAIELHDPQGAQLARAFTLIQVLDDEPTPPASLGDIQVSEGQGSALLPVTRTAVSLLGHAAYRFAPRPGTAAAPGDFGGAGGRMSIASGQFGAVARIPLLDDSRHEETETFEVELVPDPGPLPTFSAFFPGPVARAVATVTIADDDPVAAPPTIVTASRLSGKVRLRGRPLTSATRALRGAKVNAAGGSARLEVTRAGATLRSATVTGGAVRVASTTELVLTSRRAAIRSSGMSVRGKRAVAAPATAGARWTIQETRRGTRVSVRGGRVRAGGVTLRAGRARTFR
jgi:hypothetical protein